MKLDYSSECHYLQFTFQYLFKSRESLKAPAIKILCNILSGSTFLDVSTNTPSSCNPSHCIQFHIILVALWVSIVGNYIVFCFPITFSLLNISVKKGVLQIVAVQQIPVHVNATYNMVSEYDWLLSYLRYGDINNNQQSIPLYIIKIMCMQTDIITHEVLLNSKTENIWFNNVDESHIH